MLKKYKEIYNLDFCKLKNDRGESVLDRFACNTKDLYSAAELCGTTLIDLINEAEKQKKDSILHYIAKYGNPDDLKPQEKKKFKEVCNTNGDTPCHYLVQSWNSGLAIEPEYYTEVRNKQGYTPRELWELMCKHPDPSSSYFQIYNQIIDSMNQDLYSYSMSEEFEWESEKSHPCNVIQLSSYCDLPDKSLDEIISTLEVEVIQKGELTSNDPDLELAIAMSLMEQMPPTSEKEHKTPAIEEIKKPLPNDNQNSSGSNNLGLFQKADKNNPDTSKSNNSEQSFCP